MTEAVTRFEVIEGGGRVYVRQDVSIELSFQDEGRTLKVFVKQNQTDQQRPVDDLLTTAIKHIERQDKGIVELLERIEKLEAALKASE